jgi:tRNA A-37 threonylcarbamoyl transferase component Bud32
LKVFGHPWKARLHARRERRGFQRLGQLGIAAPAVLLHGRTEDGRWAVVTEKIEGAMTLLEARKAAHEARQRKVLLDLAGRELARLHGVGVLQEDLHPGNFLVRNDRLVALDPGQIRFLGRPVGRTASIRQLAQLARILVPGDQADAIETVRAGYVAARRWSWGHPETALFWRCFVRGRRGAIRATARRPLYKGRDHVRIRTRNCLVVAQKAFSDAGDLGGLVENLDAVKEVLRTLSTQRSLLQSAIEWAEADDDATVKGVVVNQSAARVMADKQKQVDQQFLARIDEILKMVRQDLGAKGAF